MVWLKRDVEEGEREGEGEGKKYSKGLAAKTLFMSYKFLQRFTFISLLRLPDLTKVNYTHIS